MYFDGINVAVYSLSGMQPFMSEPAIFLGVDPVAADKKMELFNGEMDEFGVWSRVLTDDEIASLYSKIAGICAKKAPRVKDKLKVMTWNIWHGGRHQGRQVGVERVCEIIKQAGADVVLMQETYGSGAKIADALGYYFYLRSSNLSVMSRFPFGNSFNVYRPFNAGCITVKINEKREVMFSPVWLNYLPNTGAYVKSGLAVSDTIVEREMQTRGVEMKFILSELAPLIRNSDDTPIIVGGDFNSGSHLDWTSRNKPNYYDLIVRYPVSSQMGKSGFIDSFRDIWPDETEKLGRTWSPVFKNSLQDRIDYIYYKGNSLKALDSYVIDEHPLGFPSDHAAVVTTFGLK